MNPNPLHVTYDTYICMYTYTYIFTYIFMRMHTDMREWFQHIPYPSEVEPPRRVAPVHKVPIHAYYLDHVVPVHETDKLL